MTEQRLHEDDENVGRKKNGHENNSGRYETIGRYENSAAVGYENTFLMRTMVATPNSRDVLLTMTSLRASWCFVIPESN